MRGNLEISTLGDDDQRAAILWITSCELEEYHSSISMRDKIDICQPKTVENSAELFGAFDQPNGASACFTSPIHDDAPGFAQCTYLACIDKFQVFEYGYEDYGLSRPISIN